MDGLGDYERAGLIRTERKESSFGNDLDGKERALEEFGPLSWRMVGVMELIWAVSDERWGLKKSRFSSLNGIKFHA